MPFGLGLRTIIPFLVGVAAIGFVFYFENQNNKLKAKNAELTADYARLVDEYLTLDAALARTAQALLKAEAQHKRDMEAIAGKQEAERRRRLQRDTLHKEIDDAQDDGSGVLPSVFNLTLDRLRGPAEAAGDNRGAGGQAESAGTSADLY